MRSLLFVPADSERKVAKALASAADVVVLDLEDGVAADRRSVARGLCAEILAGAPAKPAMVRINALDTGLALQDLAAVVRYGPFGIMLPKARGWADLARLGDHLDALETRDGIPLGRIRLLPVATETAGAVLGLATAAPPMPRLLGMLWGGEDLAAELGATANRDARGRYGGPFLLARNLCLMASAAAGVVAVDAVFTDFRDTAGLCAEADAAARDGFGAKAAIHPDQVEHINAVFSPSATQLDESRAVVAAFAASPGVGAIALDGRMLDRPHLRAAERILARAQPPAARQGP